MANIKLGSIVTDIRGAVGDQVYSRNRGGIYVKARPGPADPPSDAQLEVQATVRALSKAWSGVLTSAHRSSWHQYVRTYINLNPLGDRVAASPIGRFCGANAIRHRLDAEIPFLEAPPKPPLWPAAFTITADSAGQTVTIVLPPTNYSPPFERLELFAFVGHPVSAGVDYYDLGYIYLDRNLRNGAWAHDPWTIGTPDVLPIGDKLFLRLVCQHHDDGHRSIPSDASCSIT